MKKSTKRPLTTRRHSLKVELDSQEEELLLADLNVIPDDSGLIIEPLHTNINDDEDAIDRLLVNSGFDHVKSNTLQKGLDQFHFTDDLAFADKPVEVTRLDKQADAAFVVEAIIDDEPLRMEVADLDCVQQASPQVSRLVKKVANEVAPELRVDAIEIDNEPPYAVENAGVPLMNNQEVDEASQEPALGLFDNASTLNTEIDPVAENVNDGLNIFSLAEQLALQHKKIMRLTIILLAVTIFSLLSLLGLYVMLARLEADMAKLVDTIEILKEDAEINHAETAID